MQAHLRFGMHRDVEVIHKQREHFDGLVIPAHILAYQAPATSVFVTSMPDKPYIIDPMTFLFQNPKNVQLNDAGELRLSVQRLCDAYQDGLADQIRRLSASGILTPAYFGDNGELCKNVLEFQVSKVETASSESSASKYLKRYAVTKAHPPRVIVPPYFRFSSVADPWYDASLSCARAIASMSAGVPVAPVICCSLEALTTEGTVKISSDYAAFQRTFIWIDDFSQTTTTASSIRAVRALVRALHAEETEPETLYGGYLMIMMAFDGMSGVSQGILYTQHKSTGLVPGAAGVPERFYIPAFREFRSLSQTDLILHKHPELICDCPTCAKHLRGNPDNIILYRDDPDLLRSHFLAVRHAEATAIQASSPDREIQALRTVADNYDASIGALPNPDAFITSSAMQGLGYLREWADAFSNEA